MHRPRRLRRSSALRNLVRETHLSAHDFVLPLFVSEKVQQRRPIASMPGVFQLSVKEVADEARAAQDLGLQAVLLFGIPEQKDEQASGAYAENGIVQKALRAIKSKCPDRCHDYRCLPVRIHEPWSLWCDTHRRRSFPCSQRRDGRVAGEDGALSRRGWRGYRGAERHDGRPRWCDSRALDATGFDQTAIMSYAAKFASAFYGPFREAAESPPQFGDRRSYQMDFANAKEALREVALDIDEGADIVMIKPALPYMDILWRVRERFGKPTAVYHVSGEYAMVKSAVEKGLLNERDAVLEIMTALKRAGADIIVTYWARELARWLRE